MTFALKMYEAPADRRRYEWSSDGSSWRGLSPAELTRWLEGVAAYPDDERREIEAGATVRVEHRTTGKPMYFRRRLTEVEKADRERQPALF